ncbi:MAG: hypothetical protein MUC63_03645, partial [Planctomycetes bacterium]|nr:hypothetical protein [Planctomycetota bacterium]
AKGDAQRLLSADTFPDQARRLRSRALEAFAEAYERFMHTGGAGDEEILLPALRFPEAFAAEKRLRFVLLVDDFHLLHGIRLSDGRGAIDAFREVLADQAEVFFVVSVIPCPFTDKYFLGDGAVFQSEFQFYPVEGLPSRSAEELAAELLGSNGQAPRVAALAANLPAHIEAIARTARRAAGDANPGPEDVDRAFASQALASHGAVHRHFEGLLSRQVAPDDMKPARLVLSRLASGKRLVGEEISRLTGKDAKELGSLLGRILGVGLFRRVGNTYYFEDPLFRFWAGHAAGPGKPPTGAFERLTGTEAHRLAEEFLAGNYDSRRDAPAAAPRKFNFRDLLARLKGREVDGARMAAPRPVRIPAFDRVQGFAFTSKDIKLYYLSGKEEGWVLLVLWKPGPVGKPLIEIFDRRASGRVHGLWFVGRGGFTEDALALAREKGIYCSSEADLDQLMQGTGG